jgi:predicted  nucleic acid-binding Zn-ribbon protein
MSTEAQLKLLFDRLEQKITYLQEHSAQLNSMVQKLEREKDALQVTISEQRGKIKELEKKAVGDKQTFTKSSKFGKIVKDNLADTADHTELKEKLDEYIREIEHLIAHLSTLS